PDSRRHVDSECRSPARRPARRRAQQGQSSQPRSTQSCSGFQGLDRSSSLSPAIRRSRISPVPRKRAERMRSSVVQAPMKGATIAGGAFLAFGLMGAYELAHDMVTLVLPARDWDMVALETFDEGFDFRLDGLSTISPSYTYAYRGRIYTGNRLNFE